MGLSQVLIQNDACISRFLFKATNMLCVSYRHAIHVFSRTQFCWQVGKSSLVSQCITSDYINTYDASLGALTNLPSWDFLSRLPFPHCRRRVRGEVSVSVPGRAGGRDHLHRPPKQRNVGELVRWCHKKRAYLLICLWPLTHVVNQTTKPTIWDWSDLVRFKAIPSLQRGHCALTHPHRLANVKQQKYYSSLFMLLVMLLISRWRTSCQRMSPMPVLSSTPSLIGDLFLAIMVLHKEPKK